MVLQIEQVLDLISLKLSLLARCHLVVGEFVQLDDLFLGKRVLNKIYFPGLDHILLVLLLVELVDLINELLNLPLILLKLLLRLANKNILLMLNGLQSGHLAVDLLLQLLLQSHNDLPPLLQHLVQFRILGSQTPVLLDQRLQIKVTYVVVLLLLRRTVLVTRFLIIVP